MSEDLDLSLVIIVLAIIMDKLLPTGWNLGQLFNFRGDFVSVLCNIPIRPNLELKTGPKQLLGTLPLGIALPAIMLCSFLMHSCVYSKEQALRSSKNILCEYETLLWLFSNAEDVFIRTKLTFFFIHRWMHQERAKQAYREHNI
jgi:hypothetical protein